MREARVGAVGFVGELRHRAGWERGGEGSIEVEETVRILLVFCIDSWIP